MLDACLAVDPDAKVACGESARGGTRPGREPRAARLAGRFSAQRPRCCPRVSRRAASAGRRDRARSASPSLAFRPAVVREGRAAPARRPLAPGAAPARLARLMIAACLAYIWIIYLGVIAKRDDWVQVIHRTDRCDLSLFQLGLRLLEHFLNEHLPIPVAFDMPLAESVR